MVAVILGLMALGAAVLGVRWFLNADPKAAATAVRWGAVLLGAALSVFVLLRVGFGGLFPLAATAFLFLRLRRGGRGGLFSGRGLGGFGGRTTPSPGQMSEVETATLRMELAHDTGEMIGQVLRGRFEGRELGSMSFEELIQLLAECHANDEQSVSLIETYLDREQGPDWREYAAAEAAGSATGKGPMTRDEAYEVLGLAPGASTEDVKAAHHRLMLKMHPDQGGSTYLASKINQAKDLLLGNA